MERNIGFVLREERIKSGLSVKEISLRLTDKGYKASEKTIYSWENGNSQPTPEVLLEMCDAYGIKDILSTFGYTGYKEDGSIQLNINEIDLVEKYRDLDDHGKVHVDTVLDWESQRAAALADLQAQLSSHNTQIFTLEPQTKSGLYLYSYLRKIACAGTGFYFDDIPTTTIEAPYVRGADFIIGVNGDSMEPNYYDGDKLYIQKVRELSIGDEGIFTVWGECFVKELGERGLISRNPAYDEIPGTEDVRLIGRVLGKIED